MGGGKIVVQGTPEQVARVKASHTGHYLQKYGKEIIRYRQASENMNTKIPHDAATMLLDKRAVRQAIAELNQRMGFVPDPNATAEEAQEMMLAEGIRPEDNIASCEIIQMRYEKLDRE